MLSVVVAIVDAVSSVLLAEKLGIFSLKALYAFSTFWSKNEKTATPCSLVFSNAKENPPKEYAAHSAKMIKVRIPAQNITTFLFASGLILRNLSSIMFCLKVV